MVGRCGYVTTAVTGQQCCTQLSVRYSFAGFINWLIELSALKSSVRSSVGSPKQNAVHAVPHFCIWEKAFCHLTWNQDRVNCYGTIFLCHNGRNASDNTLAQCLGPIQKFKDIACSGAQSDITVPPPHSQILHFTKNLRFGELSWSLVDGERLTYVSVS